MGTGKTKVVLDTAAHLFNKAEIDGVLVIAPKGGYRNWIDEIEIHVQDDLPIATAIWSAVMNKREQWEFSEILRPVDNRLDFLVMNVEAFASERVLKEALLFLKSHYTMVVIDESSTIKSPRAARTKRILKLRDQCDYRRILSGTPITQGPLDLYTQAEFLSRGLSGFRTFTEYRSFYSVIVNIHLPSGKSFPKIEGYVNLKKLETDIQRWSSRVLKVDCLDLPEKVYETYHVEHTPEQSRAYHDLKDSAFTQLDNGEIVTVTEALTLIRRLQQINSGFLKHEGEIIPLPSMRPHALMEVLDQIQGKAIIWATYHYDMDQIQEVLKKKYGRDSYGLYYGLTSDDERDETRRRFREDPTCRWFVGSPATGGMSLTLVQASTVVYYTSDYSLQNRLQSEDRAHRIGQTENVTYIDLIVRRTVDSAIVRALRKKKDLSQSILSDFREILSE
jgi:SNF2 family DNA or RNA helicase